MLDTPLLRRTAARFLGEGETEIVDRSNHFFLRLTAEADRQVLKRLLILAPNGYTGVEADLLNVHPEARTVKLTILGELAAGKRGYRPLVEEVRFLYAAQRDVPTIDNLPYARFSDEYCAATLKSWRNSWYAVNMSGWGNYHSLQNLSDEWVVVSVEKHLLDRKEVTSEALLFGLNPDEREAACRFGVLVKALGDRFFEDPEASLVVSQMDNEKLADLCLLLLNLAETGRHEPCTSFAILLQLARRDKRMIEGKVEEAIRRGISPYYYLQDLQRKLARL